MVVVQIFYARVQRAVGVAERSPGFDAMQHRRCDATDKIENPQTAMRLVHD